MVWCGVVWCGVVWCGVVWCGVVWCGVVWCGVVWCGVVWCGVVWCGVVWCGVVWCGVVGMMSDVRTSLQIYAMIFHGMVSSRAEAFGWNMALLLPVFLLELVLLYVLTCSTWIVQGPESDGEKADADDGDVHEPFLPGPRTGRRTLFAPILALVVVATTAALIICDVLQPALVLTAVCLIMARLSSSSSAAGFGILLSVLCLSLCSICLMLMIELVAVSPAPVQAALVNAQDFAFMKLTDHWAVESIMEATTSGSSKVHFDDPGLPRTVIMHPLPSCSDEAMDSSYPANVLLQRVAARYAREGDLEKAFHVAVKVYAILREALLLPMIAVPFVLDPYLKKFVDRKTGSHYVFLLHGAGANSGQWLLGRLFLLLRGFDGRVYYANYLGGFAHVEAVGGVDDIAERILVPQLGAELQRLLDLRPSGSPVEISLFGHSLGADLIAELGHRVYFEPDGPQPGLYSRGLASLRDPRVAFRNLVTLSGPFHGSAALQFFKAHLPPGAYRRFFGDPPNPDFEFGSAKAKELARYVHKELVFGGRPWGLTQIGCGTDWIVVPESGLCEAEWDTRVPCRNTTGAGPRSFVYVEAVGHYTSVAVSPVWRRVLLALGPLREATPAGTK